MTSSRGKIALPSKTFIPVLMPRSRAWREEDTIVAAFVAYAAIASGRPRRVRSCCCSIEAKAQFRSTTRVVGEAVLRPSSFGAIVKQMFAQNDGPWFRSPVGLPTDEKGRARNHEGGEHQQEHRNVDLRRFEHQPVV